MDQRSSQALAAALWPMGRAAGVIRAAALAFAGAIAITLGAKVQIPFYPVPMTLQSLAVLSIGAAFGLRLGVATLALYLGEGLAGLPVFAGAGAGPAYMAGATGGYLIGFLAAAAIAGALADRGWTQSWPRRLATMALAQATIYALGLPWLAAVIGAEKAIAAGLLPFLGADLCKTLLACALVAAGWSGARRLRRPQG